jgi:superfamily I DNA/RNA helicase
MKFLIADTFTSSLAKLTGDEQKAVKTTAFDLQLNPASPGMKLHRVDMARDPDFWSARVNRDVRLMLHRTGASCVLCYVDHHDAAYAWAERRRMEVHPVTGAAQLVEIREKVVEIPVHVHVAQPAPLSPPLFADLDDAMLLGYGVPAEWLEQVRGATDATVLDVADRLPAEAAEALLRLAVGETPEPATVAATGTDPFEHPDAQRRFRVVDNVEELARALEYPWEKWTIFLHPAQRETVIREYGGPARVSGSAGTGKTIVALHRAAHLARVHEVERVLLTTFSPALARNLHTRLRRLIGEEPRLAERIDVQALDDVAIRLHQRVIRPVSLASPSTIDQALRDAAVAADIQRYGASFLRAEWNDVVDAWQIRTWEAYRDVARLGRRARLPEAQRQALWPVFEGVWKRLAAEESSTLARLYARLAEHYAAGKRPPYEYIVVDEAQDLGIQQLRFLAAIGKDRPNSLFFAGDLGQRIFQQPFSWKSLGVDIRGRSRTLRINYRTSHQIRSQADLLLDPVIADVDGNLEERAGTVSVFNGTDPEFALLDSPDAETAAVSAWLAARVSEDMVPHEIAVFVRSEAELPRALEAVTAAGLQHVVLDERVEPRSGHVAVSTMHFAKGMEFRAVAVMACEDEIVPLQERIASVADPGDLEDVYNTERYLLYVACTRARDHLLISSGGVATEFLEDLRAGSGPSPKPVRARSNR